MLIKSACYVLLKDRDIFWGLKIPRSYENREGDKTHTYGRYQNVFLSSVELAELQTELPTLWEQYIERLSEYMKSSGKEYKNHAATIRCWANADKKKEKPPARNRDYRVEEGETI